MRAESLTGVAGDDRAVNDGSLQVVKGGLGFAIGGQPASQATEEGVSGAGWVKDAGQWISGAGEEVAVFAEEVAAVLTALHDDVFGAFGEETTACFNEIGRASEFLGLTIIDDEQVDALEHVMQALIGNADPQIHRVGGDEIDGTALVEHLHLVFGMHVGRDGDLGLLRGVWELDGPVFQHVHGHVVRGAVVHVLMVFTRPGEGGAAAALETVEIDTVTCEHVEMGFWEIVSDDANEMDGLAEDACGQCCVAGGATEEVLLGILWGFDIIESDTTSDDNGHERLGWVK